MFESYTFFKDPDGAIYGVAPRVMESGFAPDETHVRATPEEKLAFIQRAVDQTTLPRPTTPEELQMAALDLRDKGVFPFGIKKITGIDVEALSTKELAAIEKLRTIRDTKAK